MKKLLLLLILTHTLTAQQVYFNDIRWETAVKWSKETKRNIFLYVYAESSPSSKTFESTTLVEPELTEYLNGHFLCVKMNASSEQGLDFQDKYKIERLPAVLFFGMYDNLILQKTGQIPAAEMLEICDKVNHLAFEDDLVNNYWKEFENGKRDVEFLRKYIKLLKEMNYDNSIMLEALFEQLPDNERINDENLTILNIANINYLDITSQVYQFLTSIKDEQIHKKYSKLKSQIKSIIYGSIPQAGEKKDENIFLKADSLISTFEDKNEATNMQFLRRVNFYQNLPNSEKLKGYVYEYLEKNVLHVPDSTKKKKDEYYLTTHTIPTIDESFSRMSFPYFYSFDKPYSQWLATLQSLSANGLVNSFKEDNTVLEKALIWANNAIEFSEKEYYLIVKAKILYRLNQKDEAKALVKKAIELNSARKFRKHYYQHEDFEGLLELMEKETF